MASAFVASIGTVIAGAVAWGWSQKNSRGEEKWDPNKYVIDPSTSVQRENEAFSVEK